MNDGLKIVSWNMNEKDDAESWEWLLRTGADLALLQEAKRPAVNVEAVEPDPGGQMLSELGVCRI